MDTREINRNGAFHVYAKDLYICKALALHYPQRTQHTENDWSQSIILRAFPPRGATVHSRAHTVRGCNLSSFIPLVYMHLYAQKIHNRREPVIFVGQFFLFIFAHLYIIYMRAAAYRIEQEYTSAVRKEKMVMRDRRAEERHTHKSDWIPSYGVLVRA